MSWDAALDEYEVRLEEQRSAFERGRAGEVPPFAPGPGLGPLPDRLRQRAEHLLQEATELQAELELAVAAAGRETAVVRRLLADHGAASRPRLVDRPV